MYRFGDLKLQKPESKAFAQMFQKTYSGKILACHMQLLNAIRGGDYLPDRVINLVLQYLTNRCLDANDTTLYTCKMVFCDASISHHLHHPLFSLSYIKRNSH